MVADMEVAKVADMVADMMADVEVNKVSDVMLQFGEGVGHMGWLSGPKLFRSEACTSCFAKALRVYFYFQQYFLHSAFCFDICIQFLRLQRIALAG